MTPFKHLLTELKDAQRKVFHTLIQRYQPPGHHDTGSRVSILISAFKSPPHTRVETTIHVIKGLLAPESDKAAYHENVNDLGHGWIVTLHWLNSPTLASQLVENWQWTNQLQPRQLGVLDLDNGRFLTFLNRSPEGGPMGMRRSPLNRAVDGSLNFELEGRSATITLTSLRNFMVQLKASFGTFKELTATYRIETQVN